MEKGARLLLKLLEIKKSVNIALEIEKNTIKTTSKDETYSEALLRLQVIERHINALINAEKKFQEITLGGKCRKRLLSSNDLTIQHF